jgi:predicted outer membrane protein
MQTQSKIALVMGLVISCATATVIWAQDTTQQRDQRQNQAQRQNTNNQQTAQNGAQRHEMNKPVIGNTLMGADSQLAGCLIVDNQGEIALGKLAEEKAQDKDVKEFGQKMVKDHTQFLQQLEQFANEGGRMGAQSQNTAEHTMPTAGATEAAIPGSTTQPVGGQTLNLVQLKQEIGQKCLDMVKKDLEEKQGAQFDKCYIGAQIGAHMEVLATLEVFRNQASPELANVLDKGIETTKSHLEHAQKIAKALEK